MMKVYQTRPYQPGTRAALANAMKPRRMVKDDRNPKGKAVGKGKGKADV